MTRSARALLVCSVATLALMASAPPAGADGATTYSAQCAKCHGADGKGDTAVGKAMKAPDLTSADVQGKDAAALAEAVRGSAKHGAVLPKVDDMDAVIAYVLTLGD